METFKVRLVSYGFYILTRCVLVKFSHALIKRASEGTSSLALQLTTVSLYIYIYHEPRLGVHNRDREKILQTSNRVHKMQLHCTTLLAFKYGENLACISSNDL